MKPSLRKKLLGGLAAASLAVAGCATIVSTPDAPQVPQAARDRAAQQHPQILEEFGGAWEGPQAAYVARVGDRIAAAAGVPGACNFSVVNTDVVNAFAVPGCYIYVTRGLLSVMNSEAELASVLGHEVGHVVADHSGRRQQQALATGVGAILVGVLTGSGQLAQLAGQAGQLWTLRYSREQEFESDDLGVRYLAASGYDPYAAARMLGALQASDQLQTITRGREAQAVPEWARTHPLTEGRIARADAQAAATGAGRGALPAGEAAFLDAINGMLYGDDPAQGFVVGRTFAHPTLRVAFEAPQGFFLTNSTRAVLVEGPQGLRAQFAGGRLTGGSLEAHAAAVQRSILGQTQAQTGQPQRTTVNGLETVVLPARVQTQGGVVDLTVVAYRFGPETAYHFATLAPAGQAGAFDPLVRSVRRVTDQEAATLRPRRLEVVTVRQGETTATLAGRMAYGDFQVERFRALNGFAADRQPRPGERVKIVVWAR